MGKKIFCDGVSFKDLVDLLHSISLKDKLNLPFSYDEKILKDYTDSVVSACVSFGVEEFLR